MIATLENRPPLADDAVRLMTEGGDKRIILDPVTGLNQYLASPRPSGITAYASSTANDISAPAFAEVQRRLAKLAPDLTLDADGYAAALDALRGRIRAAYRLSDGVEVVFAPSGTDLEYVGLALAAQRRGGGIDNILLGVDEVGSGCIHSARGRFFADVTAIGIRVSPEAPIGGSLPGTVRLVSVPVRGPDGSPCHSDDMLLSIGAAVEAALAADRHPLVHVVHGSKTGLILPSLDHIDAIRRRHGTAVTFVVDACQARLGGEAIQAYLDRGATVFVTGSKFMGGPPFSGFALVPRIAVEQAAPLPAGFVDIFRRAEWPSLWSGASELPEGSNLGLLLRLEASIYELELFQKLGAADVRRTLDLFDEAVDALAADLGARRVMPYAAGEWQEARQHPLEMRTLVTLDLSTTPAAPDFDGARVLYRALLDDLSDRATTAEERAIAARPFRLGQPVKCVAMPDGRWGGTLRIGLSMPQMVEFAALDTTGLRARLHADMRAIGTKLKLAGLR